MVLSTPRSGGGGAAQGHPNQSSGARSTSSAPPAAEQEGIRKQEIYDEVWMDTTRPWSFLERMHGSQGAVIDHACLNLCCAMTRGPACRLLPTHAESRVWKDRRQRVNRQYILGRALQGITVTVNKVCQAYPMFLARLT